MIRAILISIREYNSCLRSVYYFPVVIATILYYQVIQPCTEYIKRQHIVALTACLDTTTINARENKYSQKGVKEL